MRLKINISYSDSDKIKPPDGRRVLESLDKIIKHSSIQEVQSDAIYAITRVFAKIFASDAA